MLTNIFFAYLLIGVVKFMLAGVATAFGVLAIFTESSQEIRGSGTPEAGGGLSVMEGLASAVVAIAAAGTVLAMDLAMCVIFWPALLAEERWEFFVPYDADLFAKEVRDGFSEDE